MNRSTILALVSAACCSPLIPGTAVGSAIETLASARTGESLVTDTNWTLSASIPETLESSASSPNQPGAYAAARAGIGQNNVDLGILCTSENQSGAPEFGSSARVGVEEDVTFFNISDPIAYDGVILKMRLKGELMITGQGANGYSRDHSSRLALSVVANFNQPDRESRNSGALEIFFTGGSSSRTEPNHSGLFLDNLNNRPRSIQTSGSPENHASLTINETVFIALPGLHLLNGPHRVRITLSAHSTSGGSSSFYNSLSFDEAEPVLLYSEDAPGQIQLFSPDETGLVVETGSGGFLPDPAPDGPSTNLALAGNPIMGHAPFDNGTFGVYHINAQGYLTPHHSETPEELNDGDIGPSSVVDTYSGDGFVDDPDLESPDGGADPYDFLGIAWSEPQDGVAEIQLYQRIFGDGGWFGGLNSAVAPKVQVSRDGGTTWLDVEGVTTDYDSLVSPTSQNGQVVGPISFSFPPQDDIDGIRLFGEGGGRAGVDVSGFVAAAEFEVYAVPQRPPPPIDPSRNLALDSNPIMGHAPLDNGTFGTYHISAQGYLTPHHSETPGELIDGSVELDSVVDTYSGDGYVDDPSLENPDGGADPYDFLGVQWSEPRDGVSLVHLYHRIFGDGGWFGGLDNAVAPKVQVSRDGGITWLDLEGVTTDYGLLVSPTSQNGQVVGPISFSFPPQDDIDGIRLFGEGGGRAGVDVSGFVAAAEFEVYAVLRPVLSVYRTGEGLRLTWSGDYRLESATTVGGEWSVVEDARSPCDLSANANAEFFRLTW
ncbi:MAG: hypothetical protein H7A46_08100 [Verrucomicrobiales bacterium]|nr:hypothetical protein [Verrucomicrobiales bacterium]